MDFVRASLYMLCYWLRFSILTNHPRMTRLSVKGCPISKHKYVSGGINTKNNSIAWIMENMIERFNYNGSLSDYDFQRLKLSLLADYARFIYVSMRYWNDYYYLFFAKNFMIQ